MTLKTEPMEWWKYGKGTKAQQLARIRSDRIRRLRGLYSQVKELVDSSLRRGAMLTFIDQELLDIGAQSETGRRDEDMKAEAIGGYYKGFGKRRHFVAYEEEP